MRWCSTFAPLVVTRETGSLCLAEKALLDEPSWPLNASHVQGFRVTNASFDEVCERLNEILQATHDADKSKAAHWEVMVNRRDACHMFSPRALPWKDPITAEIHAGTARDLICQIAALQPNCFWGADAGWVPGCEAETRYCDVVFGSWSDLRDKTSGELARMLTSGSLKNAAGGEYLDYYDLAFDMLSELSTRGAEGVNALIQACGSGKDPKARMDDLHLLEYVCNWPDNAKMVYDYAGAERKRTHDQALGSALELLESIAESELGDTETSEESGTGRPNEAAEHHGSSGWALVELSLALLAVAGAVVLAVAIARARRKRQQR